MPHARAVFQPQKSHSVLKPSVSGPACRLLASPLGFKRQLRDLHGGDQICGSVRGASFCIPRRAAGLAEGTPDCVQTGCTWNAGSGPHSAGVMSRVPSCPAGSTWGNWISARLLQHGLGGLS